MNVMSQSKNNDNLEIVCECVRLDFREGFDKSIWMAERTGKGDVVSGALRSLLIWEERKKKMKVYSY
jgi:hypothetical protein